MLNQINEIKQNKESITLRVFLKDMAYAGKRNKKNTKAIINSRKKKVPESHPLDKKYTKIGHSFKRMMQDKNYLKERLQRS